MCILIGLVKIGLLIFEILPMLIDYRILWKANTVGMAGGDIYALNYERFMHKAWGIRSILRALHKKYNFFCFYAMLQIRCISCCVSCSEFGKSHPGIMTTLFSLYKFWLLFSFALSESRKKLNLRQSLLSSFSTMFFLTRKSWGKFCGIFWKMSFTLLVMRLFLIKYHLPDVANTLFT